MVEIESIIELDDGIWDLECPEWPNVTSAPNVLRLIQPTQKSKRMAEKGLVMVNAVEMRMKMGTKKQQNRMH